MSYKELLLQSAVALLIFWKYRNVSCWDHSIYGQCFRPCQYPDCTIGCFSSNASVLCPEDHCVSGVCCMTHHISHGDCKGLHCDVNCYGKHCTTGCFGDKCKATCNGTACHAQCNGRDCASTCYGTYCRTSCGGRYCKSDCHGVNCTFSKVASVIRETSAEHGVDSYEEYDGEYSDTETDDESTTQTEDNDQTFLDLTSLRGIQSGLRLKLNLSWF